MMEKLIVRYPSLIIGLFLVILIGNNCLTFDENGYIIYCPCMGKLKWSTYNVGSFELVTRSTSHLHFQEDSEIKQNNFSALCFLPLISIGPLFYLLSSSTTINMLISLLLISISG